MEEGVGHAKLEEDDKEVHNLTTNETEEIYIVPEEIFYTQFIHKESYLLWMFLEKKLTRISFFSS